MLNGPVKEVGQSFGKVKRFFAQPPESAKAGFVMARFSIWIAVASVMALAIRAAADIYA